MPSKITTFQITPPEYQARIEKLLGVLHEQGLAGVVLFDREYILYYTGFAFIPTERPMAFVMNAVGTGRYLCRGWNKSTLMPMLWWTRWRRTPSTPSIRTPWLV